MIIRRYSVLTTNFSNRNNLYPFKIKEGINNSITCTQKRTINSKKTKSEETIEIFHGYRIIFPNLNRIGNIKETITMDKSSKDEKNDDGISHKVDSSLS